MKQKPSLQFYIQDFLGSADVQMMDAAEVGVYCLLLFNLANNGGALPADPEKLKLLCRGVTPSENVMKKFYAVRIADASFIRNERIDFELKKKKKFSLEMKALAEKRWLKANETPCGTHTDTDCVPECFSISISSLNKKKKKEKKIINGEDFRGRENSFDAFLDRCKVKKIQPGISPKYYFQIEDEYRGRVNFWKEVIGCIDWLFDNGFTSINAQRLRNRMKNAIKFAKDQEIKTMQHFQDKKFAPPAKSKVPPWRPPVIEGEIDDLSEENFI